jgi:hypothetical protein
MARRKRNGTPLTARTCKQITDLLSKYLNDGLGPRLKRDFEHHLKICPDCVAFLNTYRKTVSLVHSIRAEDMPDSVRRNILTFLKSRARRGRTQP